MGGKRKRNSFHEVKDKYPEFIRTQIIPATPGGAANTATVGTLTAFTWEIPVELNLDHPVYIELEKLVVYVETVTGAALSTTADANDMQSQEIFHVVLMKEPRTALPAEDDNAMIGHWDFRDTKLWASTSAAANNIGYSVDPELRSERDYQDFKTGNGLLLTQPRLFILAQRTQTSGDVAITPIERPVNFKMQFRLVTDVTAREFMTEIVAQFN